MKRKLYTLFVVLAISMFTFNSCDKYLTIQPSNVIVPRSLQDVKMMVGKYLRSMQNGDIQSFCLYRTGGYANSQDLFQFEDDFNYDGMFFLLYDLYEQKGKRWLNSDWEQTIWNALYQNIGDFNLYIYELERIQDNSDEAKKIEAEVRMCRAISYFRLIQLFCPYRANEFAADPERYGLPVLEKEEDLQDKYFPERRSQQSTYQFVLDELAKIEALDVEAGDWNLFYNRRALYGLLAEIHFWKAESPAKAADDWEKVRTYATKAIDGNRMAQTPQEIESMFNPLGVSPSPALSVNVVPDYGGYYSDVFADDWSPVTVEDAVIGLYSDDDYRKALWIDPATKYLIKYEQADEADFNISVLWRVEEMNLMIAESWVHAGDEKQARDYLDKVRAVRMPVPPAYTDVMQEIKDERRREFLGESYCRWKDMKRYGLSLVRYTRKDNQKLELKPNDYRYTFIIPAETELQQNPNNFQNPGWNNQEK